jgi:hypothetical protein
MSELLSSGRAIDLALAVMVLELVALAVVRGRAAGGLRPLDMAGQMVAGATLLLALRCAVRGGDYRWTLAFVTASFPAHLFDLARRARAARPQRP